MDISQKTKQIIKPGEVLVYQSEVRASFFVCLQCCDDEELGCHYLMMNRDGRIYWYNKRSVARGKLI